MVSRATSNPYQPTAEITRPESITVGGIEFPGDMRRGRVGQVQILGVLMIVQGILDTLASVGLAGYAFALRNALNGNPDNGGPGISAEAQQFVVFITAGTFLIFLLAGVANILGGIYAIRFRRRGAVLAALVVGLAMLVSCYCFPTSLALFAYGMLVLLGQPVVLAFQLRKQGHSVKEIQQAFLELSTNG